MAAACRTSVLKKLCSLVHQSSPPVQSNPVQSTGPVQSTSLVQRLCTRNPAYEDLSHICLYTDMWLWLCKVSWEYCCTNIYWNLQMDGSWGKILTCCIHAIAYLIVIVLTIPDSQRSTSFIPLRCIFLWNGPVGASGTQTALWRRQWSGSSL